MIEHVATLKLSMLAASRRAVFAAAQPQRLTPERAGLFRAICQLTALIAALAAPCAGAQAQVSAASCGPVWGTKHFGPLDYRKSRFTAENYVEPFHFTPAVEALIRGQSSSIGSDINYTLRAFPNHHRALIALSRWTKRQKSAQTYGMEWPVECYFERATRFAPDDLVVRGLYAQWLGEAGRRADAERQLTTALDLAKDDPISNYSIGLLYFELGAFEQALAQAHRSLELGWTKPELADKLKQAGKWQDAVDKSRPAAPPAEPPSAPDGQR